jgi:hypothetical protein
MDAGDRRSGLERALLIGSRDQISGHVRRLGSYLASHRRRRRS